MSPKGLPRKFACAFFFIFWNNLAIASAFEGGRTGECFSSVDDYLLTVFGQGYELDDNIEARPLSSNAGNVITLAVDKTPGLNPTYVLLQQKDNAKHCVVLTAPYVSNFKFSLNRDGSLPTEVVTIDTPPPGFPATRVAYRLKNTGVYAPKSCLLIFPNNKKSKISCDKAFGDSRN